MGPHPSSRCSSRRIWVSFLGRYDDPRKIFKLLTSTDDALLNVCEMVLTFADLVHQCPAYFVVYDCVFFFYLLQNLYRLFYRFYPLFYHL